MLGVSFFLPDAYQRLVSFNKNTGNKVSLLWIFPARTHKSSKKKKIFQLITVTKHTLRMITRVWCWRIITQKFEVFTQALVKKTTAYCSVSYWSVYEMLFINYLLSISIAKCLRNEDNKIANMVRIDNTSYCVAITIIYVL